MPGLPSPVAVAALLAATAADPSARPLALWAAALVLGLALLLLAVVALATNPRRPRPGEPTMELGSEPPAVVDLLTDDFEVTSEAVPATLLDLAARGWCELESYGPDQTICRLNRTGTPGGTGEGAGTLLPYEQRVLDHLRGLAVDGVVPAAALTTGPEDASDRWWRGFRREVIADAQARGLCRRRWPGWVPGVAWLAVLAAGGLLWASGVDSNEDGLAPLAVGVGAALLVTIAAASQVTASHRQRDTPEGVAVGGRWLGVRRYLVEHGQFADQPAAAVAVWDRYLAHAAAMDLAGLAVRQLPLGPRTTATPGAPRAASGAPSSWTTRGSSLAGAGTRRQPSSSACSGPPPRSASCGWRGATAGTPTSAASWTAPTPRCSGGPAGRRSWSAPCA